MSSHYAEYLAERTSDMIKEFSTGFIQYRYLDGGKSVYVVEIYVVPDHRKKGTASSMADMVAVEAKEKGCTEMIGSVVPSTKGSTASLSVLLAYGFELQRASNDFITFRKDI